MKKFLASLPILLPIAQTWAEKQEFIFLEVGVPLTDKQTEDARRAGVQQPENIRVQRVDKLPQPDNEDVIFVAKQIGLFAPHSSALTTGYGICVRYDCWEDRLILVHELVHVAQHERLGGIRPFLADYIRQCIDPGYPFGRLEQEALLVSRDICRPPAPAKAPDAHK